MPQPLNAAETVFTAFGVKPRFRQDLDALESRFYALSRALHPDRFAGASPEVRALSLSRMGFVNEAYRVLRDRAAIRELLLTQAGLKGDASKEAQEARQEVPMELAEAWFELQDQVSDAPERATDAVAEFLHELTTHREATESQLRALEDAYDHTPEPARLQAVAVAARRLSYLNSLARTAQGVGTGSGGAVHGA